MITHVTESFGAGVSIAVAQYMKNSSGSQQLLGRRRASEQTRVEGRIRSDAVVLVESRIDLLRAWRSRDMSQTSRIHAHSTVAGAMCRTLPRGLPVVYSPHALSFDGRPRYSVRQLGRLLERLLAQRLAGAGAVSLHEADLLLRLGIPARKIVIVPHDMSDLHGRPHRRVRSGPLKVAACGRIGFQKDPELFAGIASSFSHDGYFEFTWIGGGEAAGRDRLIASGVNVTGWLDHADVIDRISDAHVLLHTARYEGLPLACLEALALGVPVVARRLPVFEELPGVRQFESAPSAVDILRGLMNDSQYASASADAVSTSLRFTADAQHDALDQLHSLPA